MKTHASKQERRYNNKLENYPALGPDIASENTVIINTSRSKKHLDEQDTSVQPNVIEKEPVTPPEVKAVAERPVRDAQALHKDISQEDTLELKAFRLPKPMSKSGFPQGSIVNKVPMTPPVAKSFAEHPSYAGTPIIQISRVTENSVLARDLSIARDVSAVPTVHAASIVKPKKKKWLSLVLRIGCTIALFAILFKSFSWGSLLGVLSHADKGQLAVGFIVGLFCIIVSAYQWRSLLSAEHIKFDLADLVDLYLVGIAFSHFLPTGMGGDAIKAVRVGNASGNNPGSASAVVMSRVTGFFGMMLIGIPVLLLWHNHFSNELILWFLGLSLLVGGMIGGAVFFAVLLPRFVKGKWITHKVFKSGIKIGLALSVAMKRPRSLGIAILYGVIFWIASCMNHYAYAIALGIHLPLYFYFVAIPFISLVTFLPISINGFGVREWAFTYIFLSMHISPPTALLLALIMDVQALTFGSMGGCVYLFTGGKAKSEKQQQAA